MQVVDVRMIEADFVLGTNGISRRSRSAVGREKRYAVHRKGPALHG
jgi:hypothetical protein